MINMWNNPKAVSKLVCAGCGKKIGKKAWTQDPIMIDIEHSLYPCSFGDYMGSFVFCSHKCAKKLWKFPEFKLFRKADLLHQKPYTRNVLGIKR